MKRLGIVDLGSNTARLSVYEYEPSRWYRLSDEIREQIRLGEGMRVESSLDAPGVTSADLTPGAISRAEAVIRLFSDYAEATGLPELEIIATSAVRDAGNRADLLGRIDDLSHQLRILSGREEGEFSVTSAANSFGLEDAWVVDLGGGSVQISQMKSRRCVSATSRPLGVVRLRETYLKNCPESEEEIAELEAEVGKALKRLTDEIAASGLPILAIGGTIRNLARAVQKRASYPMRLLHNYPLAVDDLEKLIEKRLLGATYLERAAVPGINPDRADVILGGALLFKVLLRQSGLSELRVSGAGVREGVLFEHLLEAPHRLEDVRTFSVFNLLQQYPQPPDHVKQVRTLARELLSGLQSDHGLGPEDFALLDAAAVLHDIGMAVGYHRHHKHGAYLIQSNRLDGFSHREQALIALLVRYHRRGEPSLGAYESLMRPEDSDRLLKLTSCLRLAEQFERSRAGRVTSLQVTVRDESVEVAGPSLSEPSVELWEASKQSDLFERAWGKRLELRSTDSAANPG